MCENGNIPQRKKKEERERKVGNQEGCYHLVSAGLEKIDHDDVMM